MPEPSVAYKLLTNPPPRIQSSQGGVQVIANFVLAWNDAFTFINEVLGLGTVIGLGTPGSWEPWRWGPEPRLSAIDCSIEPFGITGAPIAGVHQGQDAGEFFSKAKATVVFGTPGYDNSSQIDPDNPITLCQQDIEFGVEYIPAATGTYKFTSDSKAVPFQVPTKLITASMSLRFPHIPYIPWEKLRPYLNTVNKFIFFDAPVGQLLFEGMSTSETAQSDGRHSKSVSLKFAYRTKPWNYVLRPSNGTWEAIQDQSGAKVYEEKDFSLMFTP